MTANRNKRGELTVAALRLGMRDQAAWFDGNLRHTVQLGYVKGSGLRLTAVVGDTRINIDRDESGAKVSGLVAGGVILWFGDDIKAARAEFRKRARHA